MAVKGIERRMVLIRTPENRCFEEAHLVLRADFYKEPCAEGDILREANRILEECGYRAEGKRRRRKRRLRNPLACFFLGALCGGTVGAAAVWMLRVLLLL
jgi:hypothetical protein